MTDTSAAWESGLLDRGYRFVFFDRLNRFYVAEEANELARRLPAEPAPWDTVAHLWDCGRAPERADHPDHVLARTLQAGFFATLPALEPALLVGLLERGLKAAGSGHFSAAVGAALLGKAEFPRPAAAAAQDLTALFATEELRAAFGRIACMYDGGHLLD
jgi:hypothetical protein